MLIIFSCTCWPFVYLWRNVYSSSLPIFKLGCLSFCCWAVWALCIFWILDPYQVDNLQIFSPILWLCIFLDPICVLCHFWCKNFTFFFVPHCKVCRILAPRPGIKPLPLAVKVRKFNYWTAREFPHHCFFFWLHHKACGTLVPRPGIKPAPATLEAWRLNHWTAKEVPRTIVLILSFEFFLCVQFWGVNVYLCMYIYTHERVWVFKGYL